MPLPLLALLSKEPAHGYELKHGLEQRLGGLYAELNIGQVYTTLARLERDGLVCSFAVAQAGRPDKKVFELTPAGRAAEAEWFGEAVGPPKLRDDFAAKLLLARTTGAADGLGLLDLQRRADLRRLRQLGQLKAGASDVATRLVVEAALLHIEADLRWLDRCEEILTEGQADP